MKLELRRRWVAFPLLALATLMLAACTTSGVPAGRGDEAAPDFELEVFGNENYEKGEVVRLSQHSGQPVVINFWYPSCPPCRLEMPDLEATWQKHRDDGLQFIGIQSLSLDTV